MDDLIKSINELIAEMRSLNRSIESLLLCDTIDDDGEKEDSEPTTYLDGTPIAK